jgi:hypothetical protein
MSSSSDEEEEEETPQKRGRALDAVDLFGEEIDGVDVHPGRRRGAARLNRPFPLLYTEDVAFTAADAEAFKEFIRVNEPIYQAWLELDPNGINRSTVLVWNSRIKRKHRRWIFEVTMDEKKQIYLEVTRFFVESKDSMRHGLASFRHLVYLRDDVSLVDQWIGNCFFCCICGISKPTHQALDTKYCLGCYPFLFNSREVEQIKARNARLLLPNH